MYGKVFWLGMGDIPSRKVDYLELTLGGVTGFSHGREAEYRAMEVRLFSVQTYNEMISQRIHVRKDTTNKNFASRLVDTPMWGDMGENVTIDGMNFNKVGIGQFYWLGEARIKIVGQLQPSDAVYDVFGERLRNFLYGDIEDDDVKRKKWGNRGFCAEVVQEGKVTMRDEIELIESVQ